ncbi:MAG: ABC transporter ATP-binding protein [Phycisphaerae bacterium]|nr:ABC transporter ATP-binding protein [Phycisphaerae bacterium]
MSPFWQLAGRMRRYRWALAGALAMALASSIGLGIGLLGAKPVLDAVLGKGRELAELSRDLNAHWAVGGMIPEGWIEALPQGRWTAVCWIMGALGVLTLVGGVTNFLHAYLSLTVVNRTTANIRREVFHRVLRLPLKDVVASGPSDMVSRIVNDTAQLSGGFTALLSKAVAQAGKGFFSLVPAFIIDWRLAGSAVLVGPPLFVVIRRLGKKIKRASKRALESQGGLYGAAVESLQGLRVVKVHTTERFEAGRFHKLNKQLLRQMNRVRTARALASPLVEALSIFALGALFMIPAFYIIKRNLDASDLIATLILLFAAGAGFKPLTGIVNDIQASAPAADRLMHLLRAAPEPGHGVRLPKLPRHADSVEFRGVTFTYPRATAPALRDVSLRVAHGERVAVVGTNGSGKTTLLALVPRLFDPDAGAVLIDGRDIREVSVRSLRRQIGVVTQETVLFRGTIRSNIGYGAEGATPERVEAAARAARAHEFISALPAGYETEVVEQGMSLSGGQRQRIAIARAILRDPAILILDEATSMIDAASEALIAEAIAEFTRGRTCLIVAHRLSTVIGADRIVVMDAGRIVDVGPHADLMRRCETYRRIAERQLIPGDSPTVSDRPASGP